MTKLIQYAARVGTALLLMLLVWSCATVPGLKEEANGTFIRIPFVRVLLEENKSEISVAADEAFAIECLAGGEQTVYYSNRPVTVSNEGRFVKVENHSGELIQGRLDEVNIIPRGNNNRLKMEKSRYRGILKILPNGQSIQLINIVYIEDYLKGVVPPEIGDREDRELEAVKAQAVAARTYALSHLQQYNNAPYDMKSSIIDQVYEGAGAEKKLVNKAIDLTTGSVLFHQDKYVNAYYHSTCGGMTDDVASVWDRAEVPYLKPVRDDDACSWSKYFRWKEVFTEDQLRGRVEQYLSSDRGRDLRLSRIREITAEERTPGGRVARLVIKTDDEIYKFHKDRIRWVVRRTSNPDLILPSDNFEIRVEKDGQGYVSRVTFEGRGYGHGVGMCQCGAIGLARKGWTYDRILALYYTGAELRKLF